MPPQIITLEGKEYVVLPKTEYDLLVTLAKVAQLMPPLPPLDANSNVPAVAYARAGLARKIISSRCNLGWSQQKLADASGVRIETIRRVESGQHTPSVPTIERIDRALTAAEAKQKRKVRRNETRSGSVPPQILTLGEEEYVLLPQEEYDLLVARAEAAELDLPPLPPVDADGNFPASATVRAK